MKNKNQETDGYGRDKRPKTEKLKRKEKTSNDNWKLEKNWNIEKSRKVRSNNGLEKHVIDVDVKRATGRSKANSKKLNDISTWTWLGLIRGHSEAGQRTPTEVNAAPSTTVHRSTLASTKTKDKSTMSQRY